MAEEASPPQPTQCECLLKIYRRNLIDIPQCTQTVGCVCLAIVNSLSTYHDGDPKTVSTFVEYRTEVTKLGDLSLDSQLHKGMTDFLLDPVGLARCIFADHSVIASYLFGVQPNCPVIARNQLTKNQVIAHMKELSEYNKFLNDPTFSVATPTGEPHSGEFHAGLKQLGIIARAMRMTESKRTVRDMTEEEVYADVPSLKDVPEFRLSHRNIMVNLPHHSVRPAALLADSLSFLYNELVPGSTTLFDSKDGRRYIVVSPHIPESGVMRCEKVVHHVKEYPEESSQPIVISPPSTTARASTPSASESRTSAKGTRSTSKKRGGNPTKTAKDTTPKAEAQPVILQATGSEKPQPAVLDVVEEECSIVFTADRSLVKQSQSLLQHKRFYHQLPLLPLPSLDKLPCVDTITLVPSPPLKQFPLPAPSESVKGQGSGDGESQDGRRSPQPPQGTKRTNPQRTTDRQKKQAAETVTSANNKDPKRGRGSRLGKGEKDESPIKENEDKELNPCAIANIVLAEGYVIKATTGVFSLATHHGTTITIEVPTAKPNQEVPSNPSDDENKEQNTEGTMTVSVSHLFTYRHNVVWDGPMWLGCVDVNTDGLYDINVRCVFDICLPKGDEHPLIDWHIEALVSQSSLPHSVTHQETKSETLVTLAECSNGCVQVHPVLQSLCPLNDMSQSESSKGEQEELVEGEISEQSSTPFDPRCLSLFGILTYGCKGLEEEFCCFDCDLFLTDGCVRAELDGAELKVEGHTLILRTATSVLESDFKKGSLMPNSARHNQRIRNLEARNKELARYLDPRRVHSRLFEFDKNSPDEMKNEATLRAEIEHNKCAAWDETADDNVLGVMEATHGAVHFTFDPPTIQTTDFLGNSVLATPERVVTQREQNSESREGEGLELPGINCVPQQHNKENKMVTFLPAVITLPRVLILGPQYFMQMDTVDSIVEGVHDTPSFSFCDWVGVPWAAGAAGRRLGAGKKKLRHIQHVVPNAPLGFVDRIELATQRYIEYQAKRFAFNQSHTSANNANAGWQGPTTQALSVLKEDPDNKVLVSNVEECDIQLPSTEVEGANLATNDNEETERSMFLSKQEQMARLNELVRDARKHQRSRRKADNHDKADEIEDNRGRDSDGNGEEEEEEEAMELIECNTRDKNYDRPDEYGTGEGRYEQGEEEEEFDDFDPRFPCCTTSPLMKHYRRLVRTTPFNQGAIDNFKITKK